MTDTSTRTNFNKEDYLHSADVLFIDTYILLDTLIQDSKSGKTILKVEVPDNARYDIDTCEIRTPSFSILKVDKRGNNPTIFYSSGENSLHIQRRFLGNSRVKLEGMENSLRGAEIMDNAQALSFMKDIVEFAQSPELRPQEDKTTTDTVTPQQP